VEDFSGVVSLKNSLRFARASCFRIAFSRNTSFFLPFELLESAPAFLP